MLADDFGNFLISQLLAKTADFQRRDNDIGNGDAQRQCDERIEKDGTDCSVRIGEVFEQGKGDECGQKDNDKENYPFVKLVQVVFFEKLPYFIIQKLNL